MLLKYIDGKKKVSVAALQFDAACEDVDLGSIKEITAELREMGWTKYRNHKGVQWLAPGETAASAGAMAVKNGAIVIARMIRGMKDDFIDSKSFADMCLAAMGLGLDDDMPGKLMNKIALEMMPRMGWYLDKANKVNGFPAWRRKTIKPVAPADVEI